MIGRRRVQPCKFQKLATLLEGGEHEGGVKYIERKEKHRAKMTATLSQVYCYIHQTRTHTCTRISSGVHQAISCRGKLFVVKNGGVYKTLMSLAIYER